MFFSAELLAKKNPLGVVWLVSHGKKVSKQRIMQIKVKDMCEELLNPEVPHALRLQGILCAGVTLVFSRQQNYLLHDAQEMMRRVSRAMLPAKSEETLLPAGKNAAALDAITLDLGSGPLNDVLALRPGPTWSKGREDEEDVLFYPDMDIETEQFEAQNAILPLWETAYVDDNPNKKTASVRLDIDTAEIARISHRAPGGASVLLAEPEVFQVDSIVEERSLEQDEEFNVAMQPDIDVEHGQQQHELNLEEQAADMIQSVTLIEPASSHPIVSQGCKKKRRRAKPIAVDTDLLINTHTYRDWQQDASDIADAPRSVKKRRLLLLKAIDEAATQPLAERLQAPAVIEFRDHPELKSLFSSPADSVGILIAEQEVKPNTSAGDGPQGIAQEMNYTSDHKAFSPVPLPPSEDEEEEHERACELEGTDTVGHMLSEQGIPGATALLAQRAMAGNDLEVERLRARGDTPATNSTGPSQLAPSSGLLTPGSVPRFDRPGSPGTAVFNGRESSPMQPAGSAASPALLRFKFRTSTPHTCSANRVAATLSPDAEDEKRMFPNGDFVGMDLGGPETLAHHADDAGLRRKLVQSASNDFTEAQAPPETWSLICDLKAAFGKEEIDASCPSLSLFDAIVGSGLNRFQAARLFHQVMILVSHGIVEAEQSEPGGDLVLRPGHRL